MDKSILDIDFKEESPKEFYRGYDKGREIYNKCFSRQYLQGVFKSNPYKIIDEKIKYFAWMDGLVQGYDDEDKNNIKTQIA